MVKVTYQGLIIFCYGLISVSAIVSDCPPEGGGVADQRMERTEAR